MILILRGHIRDAFNTPDLKFLIQDLYQLDPHLEIYIHTWSIFSNNLSWREVDVNAQQVTATTIYTYLNELSSLVKHIIIDDDSTIQLVGNLSGMVCSSKMPVLGWKNYWYGKYKIIEHLHNTRSNQLVINTRFDVLDNSNSLDRMDILHFIEENQHSTLTSNTFISDVNCLGIDNLYLGTIDTMYRLAYHFFYHLDDIQQNYQDISNQEKLVYLVNQELCKPSYLYWNLFFILLIGIIFREEIYDGVQYVVNRWKMFYAEWGLPCLLPGRECRPDTEISP
jgi:hypothetical protein